MERKTMIKELTEIGIKASTKDSTVRLVSKYEKNFGIPESVVDAMIAAPSAIESVGVVPVKVESAKAVVAIVRPPASTQRPASKKSMRKKNAALIAARIAAEGRERMARRRYKKQAKRA